MLKGSGYTTKAACEALGISRSSYYSVRKVRVSEWSGGCKEDELLERIKEIKAEHPFWGYRRVTAWLKHREGLKVNHKRVHKVMKGHGLLATQTVHKAKRVSQRGKPRAERPRQYWGIDMTKFMIPTIGWVYLVIVLDWYTKKIVGWNLSLRSRAVEWKEALEAAINEEFSDGVRGKGLKLISDNGSQPTATSFMRDMAVLGIEQIFTSYDNPKGNADTERVMRTIKEEVIWLNEFGSLEQARQRLKRWIEVEYNRLYVHSVLGYKSPEEFEAEYYAKEALKEAA
ncbi:transposase InsO family protein [Schleiferia thermophila]|uniref:Transposase InsO family protein n=2 Tax=Schleiferia thermophila TaxID=884107 RepID=A0A369A219_9FLAO|nr:transposase InsO family protein [Schleiferia thermophila]GCD80711.1 transposase [Schleiferia thermophila]